MKQAIAQGPGVAGKDVGIRPGSKDVSNLANQPRSPASESTVSLQQGDDVKLIAFSTTGSGLGAELDPRFGRAQQFLLYDLATGQSCLIGNQQSRLAAQGAGIHAAEVIVKAGADTLVTGHCGPKAFRVLDAAGVKVYSCPTIPVQDALAALQDGTLLMATAADVEGHW